MREHEFAVWAPTPEQVRLEVDGAVHPMSPAPSGDGWWRATVAASDGARYGFLLDDDPTVLPDPRSPRQPDGVHERSQLWDAGATWMPLGHALGRMGCFFAGCCWGAPSDVPWALQFPAESVAYGVGEVPRHGDHTVALHPTQLYEVIGLLLLFGVLLAIRRRRGIEPPWRQVSRYAIGYGLLRCVVEAFRGDPSRGLLFEGRAPLVAGWLGLPAEQPLLLSVSQAIALAMVALGLWGLRRR